MHVPVLLQSTIELLQIKAGDKIVDATLGLGGHAKELAEQTGQTGLLIGLDADANLLAKAEENLRNVPCQTIFINTNFRYLASALDKEGIAKVDKILFDLGLNSEHFDSSGRGFTFQKDEPLLMTLSPEITEETLTAREIVNTWAEESLADIIYGYGEERLSRRIAHAIVEARKTKKIETTFDLVEIVKAVMPANRLHSKTHFATKTFQALRITVNDEIGALKEGLAGAWEKLDSNGRLAVISFHSLEARTVKNFFKEKVAEGVGLLVNKKAIAPSRGEELSNPRSRSAQLRVIKKINE
ncbi:MAG TPA: 16S rRNA (cytosine(1402)-N(4))-methyltransferase RsmH [Candidatus Paceibacterota bacterium]|nr:16S rRNA (cytosine(1402)-N(4))-methyltransferase RsmH [Candidatus Paceibacterota bacterium]